MEATRRALCLFLILAFTFIVFLDPAACTKETIIEGEENFKFGVSSETDKTEIEKTVHQNKLGLGDVLVIIRSQYYKYHRSKAEVLKKNLLEQAKMISGEENLLNVLMTQENWAPYGHWTILPLVKILFGDHAKGKKWIFFCEDATEINLEKLVEVLGRFSSKKRKFLGHALRDTEPAIIHHFAFFEDPSVFAFPDFGAGWAISSSLLKWLDNRLSKDPPSMDFSIDVQHEVAMYINNKNKGFNLTDVKEFCVNQKLDQSDCATTVNKDEPNCGSVQNDDIFVAVKTCEKFHNTRLPFVLKTIGVDANHIVYYSDKADKDIPTEFIGVPNTETGHCTKLYKIIEKAHIDNEIKKKPWLVIIDDDTIINFSRLQRALACYDPSEPILLGERYAYGVNYESFGYEYITGGGGMILSRRGVEMLMKSGCRCSADNSPDDMWLGGCFRQMGIASVHNPSFHQARPSEYVQELLQHQYLVSFHKHYLVDPMDVYKRYLTDKSTKDEL